MFSEILYDWDIDILIWYIDCDIHRSMIVICLLQNLRLPFIFIFCSLLFNFTFYLILRLNSIKAKKHIFREKISSLKKQKKICFHNKKQKKKKARKKKKTVLFLSF